MAITNLAAFSQNTKTGFAEATTAGVVTSDTPTETLLVATAGSDGALLSSLTATPRDTVTATALYFFVKKAAAAKFLSGSVLMAAHTVAATTAIPVTTFSEISQSKPLRLEAGDTVFVSIGVNITNGIVFTAEWTDF